MYRPLPLPRRIPLPSAKDAKFLSEMGFTLFPSNGEQHISYRAPPGWRLINNSEEDHLPVWKFVDSYNMVRVLVSGSWKGVFDNKLNLEIVHAPYHYSPRRKSSTLAEITATELKIE